MQGGSWVHKVDTLAVIFENLEVNTMHNFAYTHESRLHVLSGLSIKIKPKAMNQNILFIGSTYHDFWATYLFSYEQMVAGYDTVTGYFKTSESWSKTTSRHINKHLKDIDKSKIKILSQLEVDHLRSIEGIEQNLLEMAKKSDRQKLADEGCVTYVL
jgi:hypothetical protein